MATATMRGVITPSTMIVLALVLAASGASWSAASCNFSGSCKNEYYDSGYLYATCENWRGYNLKTRIYLDNQVANVNGTLVCRLFSGGGFLSSCFNIEVEDSTLSAICTDTNGDPVSTSVDLDVCITNNNASLEWCDSTVNTVSM